MLNLALGNVEPGGITAPEVRRLIAAGWEIDSHTLTHPDLTRLPASALRHELVGSRAEIRRRFGQPAAFFCYPYGRYDARVIAAVRAAGYRAATTEDEGAGVARDLYVLKRVRVSGSDTPAGLLARLSTPTRASPVSRRMREHSGYAIDGRLPSDVVRRPLSRAAPDRERRHLDGVAGA